MREEINSQECKKYKNNVTKLFIQKTVNGLRIEIPELILNLSLEGSEERSYMGRRALSQETFLQFNPKLVGIIRKVERRVDNLLNGFGNNDGEGGGLTGENFGNRF